MGNLVDTFIMCPLYELDGDGQRHNIIDKSNEEVLAMVQNEIDKAFLGDVFKLNLQILDLFTPVLQMPEELWHLAQSYEYDHALWRFLRRYREDSLLQRFRRLFFKTLLIIVDDYEPNKDNRFLIVHSDDCIVVDPSFRYETMTEEQFITRED